MARTVKVVLAEDSVLQRQILMSIVKARKNFEVFETDNGKDALKLILKHRPDIVILDVEMPGMNGFEVCFRMKSNSKLAHIPVMIVTATSKNSKKSDDELADRARADDFITKPFQSADIYKRIDQLLDKATSERPKEDGVSFRWRL